MDRRVYFLIFPQAFNRYYAVKRYLTRNIDNKSAMDLRVYFLLSPSVFKKYLSRNTGNKFSTDLRSAPLGF